MTERPEQEAYSLHRYLSQDGTPNYERIFSEGDSRFWIKNHIDPWLLGHLDDQPEIIQEDRHLNKHIEECQECRERKRSEPGIIKKKNNLLF